MEKVRENNLNFTSLKIWEVSWYKQKELIFFYLKPYYFTMSISVLQFWKCWSGWPSRTLHAVQLRVSLHSRPGHGRQPRQQLDLESVPRRFRGSTERRDNRQSSVASRQQPKSKTRRTSKENRGNSKEIAARKILARDLRSVIIVSL